MYLLELDSRELKPEARERPRRVLANVTDLGLLAKVGDASPLLWVVRLSDGQPVAGATVRIRDIKGKVRFSASSAADGTVVAPGVAKLVQVAPKAPQGDGDDHNEAYEEWDSRGEAVTARQALVMHRSSLYLGLHSEEFVQKADAPFAIQAVALTPDGKRRAAQGVKLTITRSRWDCTGLGRCERKVEAPVVTRTIDVPETGAAVERVELHQPGSYEVKLQAGDGRGGQAIASDSIYVVGKGEAFWSGDEGRIHWWWMASETRWQNQQLHDDRVELFADVLVAGETTHEYLTRAMSAGIFTVPGTLAEMMYKPTVNGRSAGGTLQVVR